MTDDFFLVLSVEWVREKGLLDFFFSSVVNLDDCALTDGQKPA